MVELLDFIGDIHSCFTELAGLLSTLGYRWNHKLDSFESSDRRKVVFLGDIADRGPNPVESLWCVKRMVESGNAFWILGNHDDKLRRWAKGNKVVLNNGLSETVKAIENSNLSKEELFKLLDRLPLFLKFDGVVAVHAAWREGEDCFGKVRTWALYGPTTGKTLSNGFPDRIDWVANREITEEDRKSVV
jgi:protein phosphatase